MKKTEAEAEAERRANLRDRLNDDGCCFCHVSAPCSLHESMTMEEDAAYAKGGAYAVLALLDAADAADAAEAEAEAAEQPPEQSRWWPAKPHPGLDALPEATRERVRLFLSAEAIGAASQHANADTLLRPSLPDILDALDNLWARAEVADRLRDRGEELEAEIGAVCGRWDAAEALLAEVTTRAEAAEVQRDLAREEAEVWKAQATRVLRDRLHARLSKGPKLPPLPEPEPIRPAAAPPPTKGFSPCPLCLVVAVAVTLTTVVLLVFGR